ncbi:MAG TPA: PfkB family carbohydrate kinase [Iamia sp.]|nr:PfkB family carbohydrate kinase [Iamia sp.]
MSTPTASATPSDGPPGAVVVVGSVNRDLVVGVDRHPLPGETLLGTSLVSTTGGKGGNQAAAAARAGAPTLLVARIGDDEGGRACLAELRGAGVDTTFTTVDPDAPTGTAVVTVAGGENTIVVVPGANGRLDDTDVPLGPGDAVVAQHETPIAPVAAAFARARAAGATTVLNPAPAAPVADDLLTLVDVLVVNEHELGIVFPGATPEAAPPFAGTVVVTLGRHGVRAWPAGGGPALDVPGRPVEAVDSTGAGDCFVGYLVAGLVAGVPLAAALDRANRAAALSTTRPGAAASVPTAAEVDALT